MANNNTKFKFLHPYFQQKQISNDDLSHISDHIREKSNRNFSYIERDLYDVENVHCGQELISDQNVFHDGTKSKTARSGTKVSSGYTPIGFDNGNLRGLKGGFAVVAGFADGFRVERALEIPTACAVGENNLIGIAEQIHESNPDLDITIIADNDNAGRRVLERAPTWAKVSTVSSAKDASDVYQESGAEQLKNELLETHTIPPVFEFMPQSKAHINNCSMSQAYMRLNREKTHQGAAKLAFLIIAKESMKCPHLRTLNEIIATIYDKAQPFMISWQTLINFKNIFERNINYRKENILKQVTITKEIKDRHEVVEVEKGYKVGEHDFFFNSVVCLNWGMGSGKTQNGGRPFAEMARKEGSHVIATCHKTVLTAELCKRLGVEEDDMHHYHDLKSLASELSGIAKGSAICLPSLTSEKLAQIVGKAKYIFIDEIDQTIKFLAAKNICRTKDGDSRMVYDMLIKIVANAERVLVADAHLSSLSIEFLEQCRPNEEFKILTMAYKSGLTVEFMADDKPKSYGRLAALLLSGEKIWISCETPKQCQEIYNFLKQIKKDFKILAVYSDNSGDKKQEAFMKDPENESLKYDVLIHSPIISSGISIEHKTPHFTHGFFFGSGCAIRSADAAQMMRRVRYIINFTVCIGLNNRKNIDNWEALKIGIENSLELEERKMKSTKYDDLVNHIEVSNAILKNDFGGSLYWLLEHDGANIKNLFDEKDRVPKSILEKVKDLTEQEKIQGILNAEDISEEEKDMIESQEFTTTKESLCILRKRLRDDLGFDSEITTKVIELWDMGRMTSKLKRFNSGFMGGYEDKDDSQKKDVTLCALKKARAVGYQRLFHGCDISSPDFCISDEVANVILNRITKNAGSRYMYSTLGIVSYKYAENVPEFKVDRLGNIKKDRAGKPIPSGKKFKMPSNPKSEVKKIFDSMGVKFNPRTYRKSLKQNVWTIKQESIQDMWHLNLRRNRDKKISYID